MSPDAMNYHKQAGLGLPAAIFIITVLALIIAGMSAVQRWSAQSVILQVQSQRAFYSAESGLQLALNLLLPPTGVARDCAVSPFYSHSFTPPVGEVSGLDDCSVSVSCRSVVAGTETFYLLDSTGTCGSGAEQAQRRLEVMVQ